MCARAGRGDAVHEWAACAPECGPDPGLRQRQRRPRPPRPQRHAAQRRPPESQRRRRGGAGGPRRPPPGPGARGGRQAGGDDVGAGHTQGAVRQAERERERALM
eukprot:1117512-Prorocentrum_minimum.AAC.1